jgi:hypothetical protein
MCERVSGAWGVVLALLGLVLAPGTLGAASGELAEARAYPVPYKASSDAAGITFTDLADGSVIRIYTVDGRLVKTLVADSSPLCFGGSCGWDPVVTDDGEPLGSDLYLYVIESPHDRKTGKLVVIR